MNTSSSRPADETRSLSVEKNVAVLGVAGRDPTATGALASVFPCADPTNPLHSNYFDRIRSFKDWPRHIRARPEELAAAGLFYLGERDRCKCFYCNGGLQNWLFEDDPMVEHAKFFPHCEFVLQQKGPDFIADINAKHPNLIRPGLSDTVTQRNRAPDTREVTMRNNLEIQQQHLQRSSIPPALNHENTHDKTNEDEIIEQAGKFGFDRRLIDIVIQKRRRTGIPFSSLADLVSAIVDQESGERDCRSEEANMHLSCPAPTLCKEVPRPLLADGTAHQDSNNMSWQSEPKEELPNQDLKSQLQAALDETICKMCFTNERDCVFLPCGHLCCCYGCGQKSKQCPLCGTKTNQVLKVYK